MDSETEELIAVLDELTTLLESDGDTHWSRWMRTAKKRVQKSDFSGIRHLLRAYGGMGSFGDLIICQRTVDGEFSWAEGHVEKNRKLSLLRSRAWELADAIKRSYEKD